MCYSFWTGALLPLCHHSHLLDASKLCRYILGVSQQGLLPEDEEGGFADKPGAFVDYYHTCYALSGLSVALHHGAHRKAKMSVTEESESTSGKVSDEGLEGMDFAEGEQSRPFIVEGEAIEKGGKPPTPREVDLLLCICEETLQAWDKLMNSSR